MLYWNLFWRRFCLHYSMKHSKVVPRFYDLLVRHFLPRSAGFTCVFLSRPSVSSKSKKYEIYFFNKSFSLPRWAANLIYWFIVSAAILLNFKPKWQPWHRVKAFYKNTYYDCDFLYEFYQKMFWSFKRMQTSLELFIDVRFINWWTVWLIKSYARRRHLLSDDCLLAFIV